MTSKDKVCQPPIYPAYCLSESPTLGKWCPFLACDIHKLTQARGFEGQNTYFHGNHPIKWVKLTGVVVSIDQYATRLILTLDDSSGVNIAAICTAPTRPEAKSLIDIPDPAMNLDSGGKLDSMAKPKLRIEQNYISPDGPKLNFKDIDVGSVVKVHGGLDQFREQMQIRLKEIRVIRDTNEEIKCWNEASSFKKNVLRQPWVISEELKAKCYRRAERGAMREMKAMKEERRKQRTEELARQQGREAKHKLHREKLAKKTTVTSRDRNPKFLLRESEQPAQRGEGLSHHNRANQHSKTSQKSLSGNYDALGI